MKTERTGAPVITLPQVIIVGALYAALSTFVVFFGVFGYNWIFPPQAAMDPVGSSIAFSLLILTVFGLLAVFEKKEGKARDSSTPKILVSWAIFCGLFEGVISASKHGEFFSGTDALVVGVFAICALLLGFALGIMADGIITIFAMIFVRHKKDGKESP